MGPDAGPARILVVHAEYRQTGGEEAVVAAEIDLLRAHGHQVDRLRFDNRAWAAPGGFWSHATRGVETVWSARARHRAAAAVAAFRPDLVHVHNTFPSASPAIYSALRRGGATVVQTLHNYRLRCPAATFFRDGRPCLDCLGLLVPLPGLVHACYRDSRAASGAVVAMLGVHNAVRTWHRHVDAFIALTSFARDLFVAGGLPAGRIAVKPNFLEPDPEATADNSPEPRRGFLFAGRLSREKGIGTLLGAADQFPGSIRIIGSGPLEGDVLRAASDGTVMADGFQPREAVLAAMRRAQALVLPSEWYEGFPMIVLEAFASRLPVVASAIGGIPEIIRDGITGLLVPPGDPQALADRLRWAQDHPDQMKQLGMAARTTYEEQYRGPRNYEMLHAIYQTARSGRRTPVAS